MMITEGVIGGAKKVVVYGPEGIGKTTFASCFPDPVFCDTEGSTRSYNLRRLPKPESWDALLDCVRWCISNSSKLGTFVLDTADWAEKLCVDHICTSNQCKSIESFGYGKGYVMLQEEFGKLLDLLSELIDCNVHVVLTAHAQMRKFEQPDELGAYDRWEMKLSKKVAPLIKEWADMVLFANYKTYVINVDNQGAAKGKNKVQGGKRVMYTTHNPCWDAKNRDGLPDELDFDFEKIFHLFDTDPKMQDPKPVPERELRIDGGDAALEAMQKVAPKPVEIAPVEKAPKNKEVSNAPPNGIPPSLWKLMREDDIKESEIMLAVAEKGYFPHDMQIRDLPNDFVDGVLVGAWTQVRKMVMENREKVPF